MVCCFIAIWFFSCSELSLALSRAQRRHVSLRPLLLGNEVISGLNNEEISFTVLVKAIPQVAKRLSLCAFRKNTENQ